MRQKLYYNFGHLEGCLFCFRRSCMVELGDEKVLYAFDKDAGAGRWSCPPGRRCAYARRTASATRCRQPEDELDGDRLGSHQSRPRAPSSWRAAVPGGALKVTVECHRVRQRRRFPAPARARACAAIASTLGARSCAKSTATSWFGTSASRIPLRPDDRRYRRGSRRASRSTAARRAAMAAIWTTRPSRQGATLYFPVCRRWRAFRLRRHARRHGRWRDQRLRRRGGWVGHGYADGAARAGA